MYTGRPHFQVIFSSFGMPEIDFGTKSEEPKHLSFFLSSGVRQCDRISTI